MHKPARAGTVRSKTAPTSDHQLDPALIHTTGSLKTRVFFDQPARPLECAGFVKAHDASDPRWKTR
ncbi:hypothetical protein AN416_07070 [Paraburkholderia caribensis]|nr:hypothetical protein AN416_07070 [Paraburkholderia caribensis]AUT52391.1 hypothetical protein C2L66_11355 [Paraburkholderia caribensis]